MALPIDAPKGRHATLTPSDTTPIDPMPDCLYIAETGDVQIVDRAGISITYPDVPVGLFQFMPFKLGEATTATVVGWYE